MLFQFCYNYIPICSNIHLPIPNLFNPFIDYLSLIHISEVFRELRRVLRSDGTLWLNIADTYCGTGNKGYHADPKNPKGRNGQQIAKNNRVSGCRCV